MARSAAKPTALPAPSNVSPISEPKRSSGTNLTLQIGLLTFPIKLHTGARADRIRFRQLHAKCLGTLKQQSMTCPQCNEDVASDEIVKGYEYRKGQFVVISAEELEAQKPESSTIIEIDRFVDASDVDPIYFETSHYVAPGDGGSKPYMLIRDILRKTGKVGIGRAAFGSSEQIILIRPFEQGIALHSLFYQSELKSAPFPIDQLTLSTAEVKLGTQLVQGMAGTFNPEDFSDGYVVNVKALVAAKIDGKAPVIPIRRAAPEKQDMLAALTASVEAVSRKKVA